jgi:ribosomal protein S6--L-glutamate ligase
LSSILHFGIVGWLWDEFETRFLQRSLRARGHHAHVFMLDQVTAKDRDGRLDVWLREVRAADLDLVVSRAQIRLASYQADVERLRLIESVDGLTIIDPPERVTRTMSKLLTMKRLSDAGVPVPKTWAAQRIEEIKEVWEPRGTVVLKPSIGHSGYDIERLGPDWAASEAIAARLLERYGQILIQEYVPHPQGDIRVIVVGGRATTGYRRVPSTSWKSNISFGAVCTPYEITPEVRRLAEAAASTMELQIAGLDIAETPDGPIIFEVNAVPGSESSDTETQDTYIAALTDLAIEAACRRR